jgi:demethylmenaquinone methyltransferase/2-methoxy-6-polyprenyl-1,4-benzoquinol methylase
MGDDVADEQELLANQIRYYEDRADVYERLYERRDEHDLGPEGNARWFAETSILESSIDSLDARGSVLEIACGTGLWTRRLAPRASRLVCVDTSPRMLQRNRELVGDAGIHYVLGDVFEWDPGERFDVIVMGFFISHIPPGRFTGFWDRVRRWLVPQGVVWFCDDAAGPDRPRTGDRVPGVPYAHRRRLRGREYTIVKVFYEPEELGAQLNGLGWEADVRSAGDDLLYGTAKARTA